MGCLHCRSSPRNASITSFSSSLLSSSSRSRSTADAIAQLPYADVLAVPAIAPRTGQSQCALLTSRRHVRGQLGRATWLQRAGEAACIMGSLPCSILAVALPRCTQAPGSAVAELRPGPTRRPCSPAPLLAARPIGTAKASIMASQQSSGAGYSTWALVLAAGSSAVAGLALGYKLAKLEAQGRRMPRLTFGARGGGSSGDSTPGERRAVGGGVARLCSPAACCLPASVLQQGHTHTRHSSDGVIPLPSPHPSQLPRRAASAAPTRRAAAACACCCWFAPTSP